MTSFYKKYEVFSPNDLCWLEVTYNIEDKHVTITDTKTGRSLLLCDGTTHQLSQIIDLLTHIKGSRFPREEPS